MKTSVFTILFTLFFSANSVFASRNRSSSSRSGRRGSKTLKLRVTNQSYRQPLSGFFVMVHNSYTTPLYVRGSRDVPASQALAELAENGNPQDLYQMYKDATGVLAVNIHTTDEGPLGPGYSTTIEVEVNDDYPLVTIASMAVNTNDCFVAINGANLYSGQVLDLVGLDAGTEENNELCECIPGPACAGMGNDEQASNPVCAGNGEGFVHVHRGIQQNGNLTGLEDWRNPMVRVVVD